MVTSKWSKGLPVTQMLRDRKIGITNYTSVYQYEVLALVPTISKTLLLTLVLTSTTENNNVSLVSLGANDSPLLCLTRSARTCSDLVNEFYRSKIKITELQT